LIEPLTVLSDQTAHKSLILLCKASNEVIPDLAHHITVQRQSLPCNINGSQSKTQQIVAQG
jgi:hypothetical protein